jgi:hypothetical protein
LTNSTTTATVTTASAHGLNTDDYVIIDGVTVSSGTNYWNQVSAKITKTGASTFTYVMAGTPGPVASLAAATSGGLGGHHAWSRWFTAGTDGKTRWVGSLGPTALTVVMDTAAKNYFMSSSQTPKYDTTLIPAAQLSAITYPGAMDKGPLLDGSGNGSTHGGYPAPYYSHIAFDSGGNDLWFGVHPNWSVTAFLAQSNDQFKLDRIGSIGFGTYPFQILEQNGRITALVAGTYTGLVQDTLSFFTDAFFAPANNNITLYTEAPTSSNDVALYLVGAGNYEGSSGSAGVRNTTHIGSHSHLIYLQEGYRHHLDMLIMRANGGVLCKTVGPGAVPGKIDIYTIRVQNSTVTPGLSGSYDGICMASTLAPREEAWALNPLFQAASICPDNLADGTAFVEKAYFQQIVSQNAAFAADMVTNVLDTNAKALGVWQFQPGIGGDDPWMQSYIGWAVGNGYLATAGESYQSNWATFINHHMKYFIGMGTKPAWMFGVQTINTKTNMTGPFQPNWASIGYYIVDSGGNYTEFWVIDGTTGWLTFSTPAEMPTGFTLNLNDQVMFTNDCFGSCGATLPTSGTDSIGNPVVISPGDTFYYIAVIDVPNTRVKISTTPGGNPIVAYNVSVAIPTPYLMPTLIAPPSTGCMSFQNAGSHLNDCLMAIRSYLKAGFDNGGGDLATTNTAVSVQSATLNYSSQMGTFNEQPRQRFLL